MAVLLAAGVPDTKNPLAEGRAGASWYHLRFDAYRQRPRSRAIGRSPAGSRATFSLSCPGGLSALSAHPLYEADGGVLLTVVAVRGSLAQPPAAAPYGADDSATALDDDPQRTVRLALDLRATV